jgi:Rps23 Pro-64 3,4-dihydroxylase Tpa1-like proline 4-hydroxylase
MQDIDRRYLASLIADKLTANVQALRQQWQAGKIRHFYIDGLLPQEVAHRIGASFPDPGTMKMKKSLREYKYIAAQMDQYNPLLEEAIYAFQEPAVVEAVYQITGIEQLIPDVNLYAGGISMMDKGKYLNPHIDNSHDKDRACYRVLNLLYYVTPEWRVENGGNLELWPEGPKGTQITIPSLFNRLAVMITHKTSWHSVSEVVADGRRCCVSNYYFSPVSIESEDYFHVTSFRGRPEQPVRDVILRADIAARQFVRRLFPKGIVENPHVYKRKK